VVLLGCFMDPTSIVMIAAPLFIPVVKALGYDTVWFSVAMIINIQLGLITPPFGLDIFTMKALTPPEVSLADVFKSSMPFLALGFVAMILVLAIPPLALWLPGLMAK
jgi:TRAP-type C4-dicarboxylate transport system permease large subunit